MSIGHRDMTERPFSIAPAWVLAAKSDPERLAMLSRWIIHSCAAWVHPSGTVRALSRRLGLGPRTLGAYVAQRRPLTPALAIHLEQMLGRHIVRREDVRPDLFLTDKEKPVPQGGGTGQG
jgi:hypothetical protein